MEYFGESYSAGKNINTSDNGTCVSGFIYWGIPLFFSTVGCILNIIAFIGLLSIKCKKPRTFLLLSLVTSNLIISSANLTVTIYDVTVTNQDDNCAIQLTVYGNFVTGESPTLLTITIITFSGVVAAEYFTLMAMAVDVLVAVWKPLNHKTIVTKHRVCVYLLGIWLCDIASVILFVVLSVVLYSGSFGEMNHIVTVIAVSLGIAVFIIICLIYVFIFYGIRMQMSQHWSANKMQRFKKSAVTTAIILVMFAICYFPFFISSYIAKGLVWSDAVIKNNALLTYWSIAVGYLLLTDTIVEPIIIIARDPLLKESFNVLIRKCGLWFNKKPASKGNSCDILSYINIETITQKSDGNETESSVS